MFFTSSPKKSNTMSIMARSSLVLVATSLYTAVSLASSLSSGESFGLDQVRLANKGIPTTLDYDLVRFYGKGQYGLSVTDAATLRDKLPKGTYLDDKFDAAGGSFTLAQYIETKQQVKAQLKAAESLGHLIDSGINNYKANVANSPTQDQLKKLQSDYDKVFDQQLSLWRKSLQKPWYEGLGNEMVLSAKDMGKSAVIAGNLANGVFKFTPEGRAFDEAVGGIDFVISTYGGSIDAEDAKKLLVISKCSLSLGKTDLAEWNVSGIKEKLGTLNACLEPLKKDMKKTTRIVGASEKLFSLIDGVDKLNNNLDVYNNLETSGYIDDWDRSYFKSRLVRDFIGVLNTGVELGKLALKKAPNSGAAIKKFDDLKGKVTPFLYAVSLAYDQNREISARYDYQEKVRHFGKNAIIYNVSAEYSKSVFELIAANLAKSRPDVVKKQSNGWYTVTIDGLIPYAKAADVYRVDPTEAKIGEKVTFQLKGENLPDSLSLVIEDAECIKPPPVFGTKPLNDLFKCTLSKNLTKPEPRSRSVRVIDQTSSKELFKGTITSASEAQPLLKISSNFTPKQITAGEKVSFQASTSYAVQLVRVVFDDLKTGASFNFPNSRGGTLWTLDQQINNPGVVPTKPNDTSRTFWIVATGMDGNDLPADGPYAVDVRPKATPPIPFKVGVGANPTSVQVNQSMTFTALVDNISDVDRAELHFPDVKVADETMARNGNTFSIKREMKTAGNNRPFEVLVYKKSDGKPIIQQGSYSVTSAPPAPAPFKIGVGASPTSVQVNQSMTFTALVDNVSDVDRAELHFPDVKVADEPMVRNGNTFSIKREMKTAGNNRPFEVLIYKKSDGKPVTQQGSYSVSSGSFVPVPLKPLIVGQPAIPAAITAGDILQINVQTDKQADKVVLVVENPHAEITLNDVGNRTHWAMSQAINTEGVRTWVLQVRDGSGQVMDDHARGQINVRAKAAPAPTPAKPQIASASPQGNLVVGQRATFLLQGSNLDNSIRVSFAGCDVPATTAVNPQTIRHECTPHLSGTQRLFWKAPGSEQEITVNNYNVMAAPVVPVPAQTKPQIIGQPAIPATITAGDILQVNVQTDKQADKVVLVVENPHAEITLNDAGNRTRWAMSQAINTEGVRPWVLQVRDGSGQVMDDHARGQLNVRAKAAPAPTPAKPQIASASPQGNLVVGQRATFLLQGSNLDNSIRVSFAGCDVPATTAVNPQTIRHECTPRLSGTQRLFWKAPGSEQELTVGNYNVAAAPAVPVPAPTPVTKPQIVGQPAIPATITAGDILQVNVQTDKQADKVVLVVENPHAEITLNDAGNRTHWAMSQAVNTEGVRPWVLQVRDGSGQVMDDHARGQLNVRAKAAPAPTPAKPQITSASPQGNLVVGQRATFLLQGSNLDNSVRVSFAGCDVPATIAVNPQTIRHECTPRLSGSQRLFWKAPGSEQEITARSIINRNTFERLRCWDGKSRKAVQAVGC